MTMKHSSEYQFLGVDGGGSRCRIRIRNSEGLITGEAIGGAANIHQDFDGTIATISGTGAAAARQAGVTPSRLHAGLGLAGLVTSVNADKIIQAGLPFASIVAENDAYVACVGAFSGGDGGIVIAGTGSIGFAVVGGVRHMVGGWGFQLGDHGSGAWLGHHAVRRAALAVDGLIEPSSFVESIAARIGSTRVALSQWSQAAAPKDYGQFAPLVFEHASRGDPQAVSIVTEGAAAISALARALLARGAGRICILGGLSEAYPPYLDEDVKRSLVMPEADAVDGAIMMARTQVGLPARWT